MKKWVIRPTPSEPCPKYSIPPFVSEIVHIRASESFYGSKIFSSDCVSDPFNMQGMEKATELISLAIDKNDKITIYGDYDCDGVTSTVLLYRYFCDSGVPFENINYYIPHRSEGYGLNMDSVKQIAKNGTKILITVDNGISAVDEIAYLRKKGITVIVTDHHEAPEVLPNASAIINPKLKDDTSGCEYLAGCGVALKLIIALEVNAAALNRSFKSYKNDLAEISDNILKEYSELAAIGTVADIVPLIGENRYIVSIGLESLAFTENLGLRELMKQCGFSGFDKNNSKEISAVNLQFSVCPRINAAGRFAHAKVAVDLLIADVYADEFSEGKIDFANFPDVKSAAAELAALNAERTAVQTAMFSEAETFITASPSVLNDKVLVVYGNNWHHGIIGIVASKLLEKYDKPSIVIAIEKENAKGSMRSVSGFSCAKLLNYCKELLTKYGGHEKAGGFELPSSDIGDFIEKIREFSAEKPFPVSSLIIDKIIKAKDITTGNADSLGFLEPFGEQNPEPIFIIQNARIISKNSLKDGKYISFFVMVENIQVKILDFSHSFADFPFNEEDVVDIAVTIASSTFNGKTELNAYLKDIRLPGIIGINQDRFFSAAEFYLKILFNKKCDPNLLKNRCLPDKKTINKVYDILKKSRKFEAAAQIAFFYNINYCMFRVACDILVETKFLQIDFVKDKHTILTPKAPAMTIEETKIYNKIITLIEE